MIYDAKQHEHDVLDAQIELLKNALHDYLTMQQNVYYARGERTSEQIDHAIATTEEYQYILEQYWRYVLVAADHKIGQELRRRRDILGHR